MIFFIARVCPSSKMCYANEYKSLFAFQRADYYAEYRSSLGPTRDFWCHDGKTISRSRLYACKRRKFSICVSRLFQRSPRAQWKTVISTRRLDVHHKALPVSNDNINHDVKTIQGRVIAHGVDYLKITLKPSCSTKRRSNHRASCAFFGKEIAMLGDAVDCAASRGVDDDGWPLCG